MYQALNTELHTLVQLANGNRTVTELIYKQHRKIITSWIVQHGGETIDAEDIFQEAMVVLFEKAQSEDFRLTCKIGTYLFAVSKHLWYKKLQKNERQPISLAYDVEEDKSMRMAYQDDIKGHEERELHYDQMNAALDKLGQPCSSLLKAFYHQDKSMQQIATEFGYTNPDNAKTQKYKCLNRLRKLFYGSQEKW